MNNYYDVHELVYQGIKSKGYFGWGNAKSLAELGDEKTNNFLIGALGKYFPQANQKSALDLGCGSGTTAFLLAKHGFDTTGIDISQTAISMAQELALQQSLKIRFIAMDLLNLKKLNAKFDLIYDSHFFHCIVFSQDRRNVLENVKASLTANGLFILDTMVLPDHEYDPTVDSDRLRFDENYILWHKTEPSNDRGVVEVNGQHWCAQRRIYPAPRVIEEVKAMGFDILEYLVDDQPDEPSILRMVLK